MSDHDERKRLIRLAKAAIEYFNGGDWQELGAHTGMLDYVVGHDRLLRSLSFGDPDYAGNAHRVLFRIAQEDPRNERIIADFIAERYGPPGENVSSAAGGRAILFSPSVFAVPDGGAERDLVAVMMPFGPAFEPVFEAIRSACSGCGLRSLRAKDIWQHSTVIQDVFSLIFRSSIVVCDFSGRNPNVFYEAGIAHTLGKHVVPMTQSPDDIPFDLRHHRYLAYLANGEGLATLRSDLAPRLRALASGSA